MPAQGLRLLGDAVGVDTQGQGGWSVSNVGASSAAERLGERRVSVHVAWMSHASCVGEDPDLFFSSQPGYRHAEARAICDTCPVISDCQEHAQDERFGVWAGNLKTSKAQGPRPINHGTNGGYRTHQRRGIPQCWECREAARIYRQNYDAAKKRSA